MSKKQIVLVVGLSLISLASWIWVHHPRLAFYSLQLVALAIVILLIKNLLRPKSFNWFDLLIITAVISLVIFHTGGPGSAFFFLVYFLLFALSFLIAPEAAIIFGLIFVLLLTPQIHSLLDLAETLSLLLVSPLAVFFGQQYLQNLIDQKRIKIFQEKWLKDEKAIESEERDVLLWLSLNFRNTLAEILEITAELLSDISQLSPQQKFLLKKMRRKIKKLLKEGERLKKKVDRAGDDEN